MKRILVTDNTHPILCEKLSAAGYHCDVQADLSYGELLAVVNNYDAMVVRITAGDDQKRIFEIE